MCGLDLGDIETSLQNQRVITVELDGISTGFRKDEANHIEIQFDHCVNIRKFDVAIHLGDDVITLVVDDSQTRATLSPSLSERDEYSDLRMTAGEVLRPDLIENPDEGLLICELVLNDQVADHDRQTDRCRMFAHQREISFWDKTR